MVQFVSSGVMIILIGGTGLAFVIQSKTSVNPWRSRWIGCSLLLMCMLLIVFGGLHYSGEVSHRVGH